MDERALREGAAQWVVAYHARLVAGGKPVAEVPEFMRRITVAEAAALQGFPLDFDFAGPTSSMYRQIGNSVPPPLAEAVAWSIMPLFAQ